MNEQREYNPFFGYAQACADRDALAQAIHDGRAILGFDNDGDKEPRITDYARYAEFWRKDAADVRKEHDAESDLIAAVEAIHSRYVQSDPIGPVCRGCGYSWPCETARALGVAS